MAHPEHGIALEALSMMVYCEQRAGKQWIGLRSNAEVATTFAERIQGDGGV